MVQNNKHKGNMNLTKDMYNKVKELYEAKRKLVLLSRK